MKISLYNRKGVIIKFAYFDDADFEKVKGYHWCLNVAGYVQARSKDGKTIVYMHRLIMDLPKNFIDHKNGNRADNRKQNLRLADFTENARNMSKKISKSSSKFKGVSWQKRAKKWEAYITLNYKKIYLGLFNSEFQAAEVYDNKAKELFGQFTKLNFSL